MIIWFVIIKKGKIVDLINVQGFDDNNPNVLVKNEFQDFKMTF